MIIIPTDSGQQYQELQRIYLDWHDGKRPLSGFIKAIQQHETRSNRLAVVTARINEIISIVDDENMINRQTFKYILDRLHDLQAELEKTEEKE